MTVQMLIDYSFLYYKYKFQLDSGYLRRLTTPMEWHGAVIEKDISQIYYSIREIEGFRRRLEGAGHDVFLAICFDMPSGRKKGAAEGAGDEAQEKYKSNRVKRLTDEDFENIQFVQKLLTEAGYNTYRFENYEADDIIACLIENYSEAFDYNVIYTPDLDLLVHIGSKVGVSRYKAKSGYSSVDMSNFTPYLEQELKCSMPYNALMLYKATVGDKSDCIDGIKKFGPKAFDKLVAHVESLGVDWAKMKDWRAVEALIIGLRDTGYFTPDQAKQALESLSLVRPMAFDDGVVQLPSSHSNQSLREQAYMKYNMRSLVE